MDTENKKEQRQIKFLKEKSVEAFLLALEIFNKPTIRYRLEGCVYSLCNAWELLLKAKMLIDEKSIYYPDKPSRTLSLTDCMKEVFSNEKDPVRQNLAVIISLRNTSTHFILPEYEFTYVPFLAFCVKAYADKLFEFLEVKISDYIKGDFLSLFSISTPPNKAEMISKYGDNLVSLFEKKDADLKPFLDCEIGDSIAYRVDVNFVRINNKSKADFTFYASNNPKDKNVTYIDRPIDANKTHEYTHHGIAKEINKIIVRDSIPFTPIKQPIPTKEHPNPDIFTIKCLDALIKRYKLKSNPDFVVQIKNGAQTVDKYSKSLITWVISKIIEDPDVVINAWNRKN